MSEPIEGLYFNWLRARVIEPKTPQYMYLDLLRILYRTEFYWDLIGDRNREEDGLELRQDFLREVRVENDPEWYSLPCSMLEVLIALSARACFQTDTPTREWFWLLMRNLNLDGYRSVSRHDAQDAEHILEMLNYRMYDASGYGGLFPLREPDEDQTKVELWIQLCQYLDEQGLA